MNAVFNLKLKPGFTVVTVVQAFSCVEKELFRDKARLNSACHSFIQL